MPRVSPFTKADIEKRKEILVPDTLTQSQFVLLFRLVPGEDHAACFADICKAFQHYKLHLLAGKQERPARATAALKLLEMKVGKCVTALARLPMGLRQELRTGDAERQLAELSENISQRIKYWKSHENPGRSPEVNRARQWFFQEVETVGAKYLPSLAKNERLRRKWAADVILEVGVRLPDEQKNRAKVTGHTRSVLPAATKPDRAPKLRSREAKKPAR